MKTLYILRHAHAESKNIVSDVARNLDDAGRMEATIISKKLIDKKLPQLIVSSSANRAMQTSSIVAEAIGYPIEKIQIEPKIYSADEEALLEILHELNDAIDCVLLTGHNPALSGFVQLLSGSFHESMATSSLVVLEFPDGNWNKIKWRKGKFKSYLLP